MTETVLPLHISTALLSTAEQEAGRAGMSVEDWFLKLATDSIRDSLVTERFFSRLPQPSDGKALIEILKSVPDNPPFPGDEL